MKLIENIALNSFNKRALDISYNEDLEGRSSIIIENEFSNKKRNCSDNLLLNEEETKNSENNIKLSINKKRKI